MVQTETLDRQAEIAKRQQKATEGLATNRYTITYLGEPESGVYSWQVENDQNGYQVNYLAAQGAWECDCPDYERLGSTLGTCKHAEMIKLARQRARGGRAAPTGANGANGQVRPHAALHPAPAVPAPSPSSQLVGSPVLPDAVPANAVPAEVANLTVPWGKYRGIRLSDLVQTEEGAGYLLWVMRKMEATSEAHAALKAAAQTVLAVRVTGEAAAILSGQQPMAEVPFGEDKGKPLDKAHPKWVAILAKKTLADAFTLKDAITYEVARQLKAKQDDRRGPGGWGRGGLDPQVAEKLAAAIEHLAVAIEKVADGHGLHGFSSAGPLAAERDPS
jgi:uncharacterized protein (DUF3820 family)